MKKPKLLFFIITVTIVLLEISCTSKTGSESFSKSKEEILNTEKEFEATLKEEGFAVAFSKFADEEAVINRNDSLLHGKKAIKEFYERKVSGKYQLVWDAEYTDISASGDLGYTYGYYTFSATDSSGQTIIHKGVFHTVWKKQADGSWKYVWD